MLGNVYRLKAAGVKLRYSPVISPSNSISQSDMHRG